MNRRRILMVIKRAWITTGIAATIVFVAWSLIAYRPNAEARLAAISDSVVVNVRGGGVWMFSSPRAEGGGGGAKAGLLFFPGALVDPTAYAPLARAVAAAGVPVTLVELPRRGAFGGADDPDLLNHALDLTRRSGGPRRWVVAGHSRGAVVATNFAATYPASLAGLVLIGTTHPRDVNLATLTAPVTKIVGTRDGIAPERKSDANRHLLPPSTRWIRIEGGNHSQFGWYGFQPGDRFATIPAPEQHGRVVAAILDMLRAAADSAARPSAPAPTPRVGVSPSMGRNLPDGQMGSALPY
ncbi:MAG: alpha/beta hydrolase [Gemmatimonadaceae bacterium]